MPPPLSASLEREVPPPPTRAAPAARLPAEDGAYGGEGTGRGWPPAVAGASAPRTPTKERSRASPRTGTPDAAPTHPPTVGATHAPTEAAQAPQA
ncbi:hypothetical protein GCM10010415_48980 [Streptomyces atrovirens]